LNFKENKSKAIALAAIFSGLYAIARMIGVASVVSLESIVGFMSAALFGPVIAVVSSLCGALISMAFFPPDQPMFFWTTLIADVFTALIIAYGRLLAFPIEKKKLLSEKKARIFSESIFYSLSVSARYIFYQLSDIFALYVGWLSPVRSNTIGQQILVYGIENIIRAIIKVVFLPVCILFAELIRKNTQTIYFDIKEIQKANNMLE